MTDTPGEGPQERPQGDRDDTTPLPPEASQPGGWQEQWQPQYPAAGGPAAGGPQGGAYGGGYAPPPQGGYAYQSPEHPKATTVLVLGILSVVLCQVLGPFAWIQGKRTLQEIDASGGRYGGRSQVQIGYVLGIVGSVILGLSLLLFLAWITFAIFAFSGVAMSS